MLIGLGQCECVERVCNRLERTKLACRLRMAQALLVRTHDLGTKSYLEGRLAESLLKGDEHVVLGTYVFGLGPYRRALGLRWYRGGGRFDWKDSIRLVPGAVLGEPSGQCGARQSGLDVSNQLRLLVGGYAIPSPPNARVQGEGGLTKRCSSGGLRGFFDPKTILSIR